MYCSHFIASRNYLRNLKFGETKPKLSILFITCLQHFNNFLFT